MRTVRTLNIKTLTAEVIIERIYNSLTGLETRLKFSQHQTSVQHKGEAVNRLKKIVIFNRNSSRIGKYSDKR